MSTGLLLVAGAACANPTGPTVVSGQVTISQSGNVLQVTNSPNSIINWQSFSIGANEITRFLQQSAASAVLNRVVGVGGTINPSTILGALQSNGRVFLINPSGIVFGVGSQVDVAGLVASSLNLSNADFLGGRLRFTEVPGAGAVVNQGAINAAAGGHVYLVGPSVTNSGIITTPQGEVVLAAGNSVELVNPGTPNLRVEIAAPDNEAVNLGQIIASSGRIGIYAGLIRSGGTLNADRAVAGPQGQILLKASRSVVVDGTIQAMDGTVVIEANDNITVNSGSVVQTGTGVPATDGTVMIEAHDSIALDTGSIIQSGTVTIAANDSIAVNSGSVIPSGTGFVTGGNICVLSVSNACGGYTPPPSVVILGNSGSGTVTVNSDPTPVVLVEGAGPLARAAKVHLLGSPVVGVISSFGTAQVVSTLSTTSQINDFTKGPGGIVVEPLPPPRTSLVFE